MRVHANQGPPRGGPWFTVPSRSSSQGHQIKNFSPRSSVSTLSQGGAADFHFCCSRFLKLGEKKTCNIQIDIESKHIPFSWLSEGGIG